jgi:hypothetical protein
MPALAVQDQVPRIHPSCGFIGRTADKQVQPRAMISSCEFERATLKGRSSSSMATCRTEHELLVEVALDLVSRKRPSHYLLTSVTNPNVTLA